MQSNFLSHLENEKCWNHEYLRRKLVDKYEDKYEETAKFDKKKINQIKNAILGVILVI